jgi:hypothetical protein
LGLKGLVVVVVDHDVVVADDFDYQELLRHVEPQVLSSMGTQRGLSNMDILEKSSKNLLYDESNGVVKNLLNCVLCYNF